MPELSIIIPVYNVEHYIHECIQSVLNQTYEDYELILVDDGSTDTSLKIIQKVQEENPDKIRVITQSNRGVSVARNLGIVESKSPYIMFVDSDDYLQEDMVKLMMHEVVEANADLVLCNVKAMKDEEGKDHDIWFSGAMRNTVESIYDNKDLINTILPAPWGKVYRKALFTENSITFPVGLRNQDLGTTPRILCHCERIAKVNHVLYNYRRHENSAVRTYDYKILDVVKNLKIVKDYYVKLKIDEIFHEQLEYLYIEHIAFRAIARVKNIDDSSMREELLEALYKTLNDEYPDWHKNPKIRSLPRIKRLYLKLIKKGYLQRMVAILNVIKR